MSFFITKYDKSPGELKLLSLEYFSMNHNIQPIHAHRSKATALASPISGFMAGCIKESMTSAIDVMLFDKRKKVVLFHDTSRNAALEVAEKVEEITM
jgi:hypothetical protein